MATRRSTVATGAGEFTVIDRQAEILPAFHAARLKRAMTETPIWNTPDGRSGYDTRRYRK